jgi:hypothetical protein
MDHATQLACSHVQRLVRDLEVRPRPSNRKRNRSRSLALSGLGGLLVSACTSGLAPTLCMHALGTHTHGSFHVPTHPRMVRMHVEPLVESPRRLSRNPRALVPRTPRTASPRRVCCRPLTRGATRRRRRRWAWWGPAPCLAPASGTRRRCRQRSSSPPCASAPARGA